MDLNLSGSYSFNKYLFNSRKQEDNESIQDFANALVNLGNTIGADENQIVDRILIRALGSIIKQPMSDTRLPKKSLRN